MTPVRLDRSSWPSVARPVRIAHIGVGNFARAHQAWYTAHAEPDGGWGIAAFTGRHTTVADTLTRQDGLYTLIERGPQSDRLEVIDVLAEIHPAADLSTLTSLIAAAPTAVVTLTVTEAGYSPSGVPGELEPVPVRLARGLAARWASGGGSLAIVSCDNVQANGSLLRALTLEAAEKLGQPEIGAWIESEVAFVSTSVDRITPRSTDRDRELVAAQLARADDAPVVCEPFTDWVLGGEFPGGRPRWELAGARFVEDVEPWERRKLWLLNGGHSLLAYMGLFRGHATVADACADPELDRALDAFWDLAVRHLPAAAELDLGAYRAQLEARFANRRIGYALTQIAADGLGKLRNRVVPVVEAAIAAGEPPDPALRIIAAWARWLDDLGELPAADAGAGDLNPLLRSVGGKDRVRVLLDMLVPSWGRHDALVDVTNRLLAGLAAGG